MFQNVGHRAARSSACGSAPNATERSRRCGTKPINDADMLDEYDENCGEATPYFYGTPNLLVTAAQTRRNIGAPTAMRGPGAVPGLFATESAYDELALALEHRSG